jgi:hypothetical protein
MMNDGQEAGAMQNNMTRSQALNGALKPPNGARFYRCALEVNANASAVPADAGATWAGS